MGAHELERFGAFIGPNRGVTMGFQQVAKELHVQFVVFNDQDGFRHPVPPHSRIAGDVNSPRQKDSGMIIQNKSDRLRKGKDQQ
jgi:hypothetical protein